MRKTSPLQLLFVHGSKVTVLNHFERVFFFGGGHIGGDGGRGLSKKSSYSIIKSVCCSQKVIDGGKKVAKNN